MSKEKTPVPEPPEKLEDLLNCPIIINGFSGDAVILTAQSFSTISLRLAEGAKIIRKILHGKERSVVETVIVIGSVRQAFRVTMFIYEESGDLIEESGLVFAALSGDEDTHFPYEVIIGTDLFDQIGLEQIDYGEKKLTGSFGTVGFGTMRRFVMKDYITTNYMTDTNRRIILFLDMDSFKVQLREQPWEKDKPRVLMNPSLRILASSFEAKQLGIDSRSTREISEAVEICPEIISINVYDSTLPADFSNQSKILNAVQNIIAEYDEGLITLQYSSENDLYLDLTKLTDQVLKADKHDQIKIINHMDVMANKTKGIKLTLNTLLFNGTVEGTPTPEYIDRRLDTLRKKPSSNNSQDQEIRLIYGAAIANLIAKGIFSLTGLQSSIGIASNKLMSKIAAGLHGPGTITILAPSGFNNFSRSIPIGLVPYMGGKVAHAIKQQCCISTLDELQNVPEFKLANCLIDQGESRSPRKLGKAEAKNILNLAHGICDKSVFSHTSMDSRRISRPLYGETYTLDEMKLILLEQLEDILAIRMFEDYIHSRNLTKITLYVDRVKQPIRSYEIEIDPDPDMTSAEELANDFNFTQCLLPWSAFWLVDKMEIVTSFQSV